MIMRDCRLQIVSDRVVTDWWGVRVSYLTQRKGCIHDVDLQQIQHACTDGGEGDSLDSSRRPCLAAGISLERHSEIQAVRPALCTAADFCEGSHELSQELELAGWGTFCSRLR